MARIRESCSQSSPTNDEAQACWDEPRDAAPFGRTAAYLLDGQWRGSVVNQRHEKWDWAAGLGAAVVVGLVSARFSSDVGYSGTLALLLGGSVLLVLIRRPTAWLASIYVAGAAASLAVIPIAEVGALEVNFGDVLLAPVVLLAWRRREVRRYWPGLWTMLFGVIALSVGILWVEGLSASPSLVSLFRLIATAVAGWIVASTFLNTRAPIEPLLVGVTIGVWVLIAGALVMNDAVLTARASAWSNPNTFGLAAALAVTLAPATRNPPLRYLAAAGGLIGLSFAKSVGGLLALVGLGVWSLGGGRRGIQRSVIVVLAVFFVAWQLVTFMRPDVLIREGGGFVGTTAERLTFGRAGLDIWQGSPIFGVGWQRSGEPAATGEMPLSYGAATRLNKLYNYRGGQGTGVHNAYVQLLAELGLIGTLVAGVAAWHTVRRGWRRGDVAVVAGLVTVGIWWNDNGLYGGQLESIIFAILCSLILGYGAFQREGGLK